VKGPSHRPEHGRSAEESANADMAVAFLQDGLGCANARVVDAIVHRRFRLIQPPQAEGKAPAFDGRDALDFEIGLLHAAFDGWHVAVRDVVAEDRRVACLWHAEGVHLGSYAGEIPTGRRVAFDGMSLFDFEDGLIAAVSSLPGRRDIMARLGCLPPASPGNAGERLVRRFWLEVVGGMNPDAADALLLRQFRRHGAHLEQGRDGFKTYLRNMLASGTGLDVTIEAMMSIGPFVITRTRLRFVSPPPGWCAEQSLVDVFRVDGDAISEHWDLR
jgi:predicted SnoaL-like aldol condensation-catalyzing enzyme